MTSSSKTYLRRATLLFLLGIVVAVSSCVPDFLVPDSDWVEIEKDTHEPVLKRKTGMLIKPRELAATIKFDSSCVYDITKVDAQDYNKVFGLGFMGTADQHMGQAPHHVDGVRIAWRWNPKQNQIDLAAYVYVGGKRIIQELPGMRINEERRLSIKIDYTNKVYTVQNSDPIPFTHKKEVAYKNGLYFGGNRPAPQKIRVMIKY